jgi:carbon storage regulator
MLVLSRKVGEQIILDNQIIVRVVSITGNRVRLGIEAPANVKIRREELPAESEPSPLWVDVPIEASTI